MSTTLPWTWPRSRAQADGTARTELDGADLFALVAALAWLGDQPALAARADHLFAWSPTPS